MKIESPLKYLLTAAVICVFFTSCKKKENAVPVSVGDIAAATDNEQAEGIFNDVSCISDQAAVGILASYSPLHNNGLDEKSMLSTCANITRDTNVIPHLITIDFSSTPCLCGDGRYRGGKIIVAFSGHYKDTMSMHTITFVNYSVNNYQISGSQTITNSGYNNNGHLTYSISVDAQIIKPNSGGTISWSSNHTREWISGETTPAFSDDVYLISGSTSGTDANGNSFSAVIASPLRKAMNCSWIESGVLQLIPSGKPALSINFGNGGCDNQASLSVRGSVYNFTLH